jgi:hypothetical protein
LDGANKAQLPIFVKKNFAARRAAPPDQFESAQEISSSAQANLQAKIPGEVLRRGNSRNAHCRT